MDSAKEICGEEYTALFTSEGLSAIRERRLTQFQSAYILRQYQHYVEIFPKLLAIGISKLDDDEARMPLVANLWDEHGEGQISKAHRNLYKRLLEKVAEASPLASPLLTQEYRNSAKRFAVECLSEVSNGTASFAMGFLGPGTEGTTMELYGILQNLLWTFALQDDDIFFGPHCALDVEHAKLFTPAIEAVLREGTFSGKGNYVAGVQKALELERKFWDGVIEEANAISNSGLV
jgi:hypothetical protein